MSLAIYVLVIPTLSVTLHPSGSLPERKLLVMNPLVDAAQDGREQQEDGPHKEQEAPQDISIEPPLQPPPPAEALYAVGKLIIGDERHTHTVEGKQKPCY